MKTLVPDGGPNQVASPPWHAASTDLCLEAPLQLVQIESLLLRLTVPLPMLPLPTVRLDPCLLNSKPPILWSLRSRVESKIQAQSDKKRGFQRYDDPWLPKV